MQITKTVVLSFRLCIINITNPHKYYDYIYLKNILGIQNMKLQIFEDDEKEFLVINRNFVPKRPIAKPGRMAPVDEESGLL